MSDYEDQSGGDALAAQELPDGSQASVLAAMQVLLAAQVPVLLWGDPGTGKTETIERFAHKAGWHTEKLVVSWHEPADFSGMPVRGADGVTFEPFGWALRIARYPGDSLAFFDEVNTAAPSVQSALMRVIHEGRVADLELGDRTRFAAAANPPEQNIGAWDLSAPLANRFAHLRWPITFEEWADGYLSGWPDTGPLHIPDDSPTSDAIADQKGAQIAFLAARPDLLVAPPTPGTPVLGWPSPRTWERLARALAIACEAGAGDDVDLLVAAGLIGLGAAIEYLAFDSGLDLPDSDALLDDPELFAQLRRGDQQHAALSAIVAKVAQDPKRQRWTPAFKVCIQAARDGAPDVAAAAAMRLIDIKPDSAGLPAGWEAFKHILIEKGSGAGSGLAA